jgi:predicted nucleic acid-binding Zn ribbon protein
MEQFTSSTQAAEKSLRRVLILRVSNSFGDALMILTHCDNVQQHTSLALNNNCAQSKYAQNKAQQTPHFHITKAVL